jgi:hypothetical protein
MLLATVLLLCPFPGTGDVDKAVAERTASVYADSTKKPSDSATVPSTPEPKIKTDTEIAESTNSASSSTSAASSAEPIAAANPPIVLKPVKPAFSRNHETASERKIWYGLSIASSGAAAFDAWSTRRAISGGYGTEANPMLRPFANSNVLYAATQVSPLVMDYIGRRMMTSRHSLLRRMWWLPQTAGMGMSFAAGVHNVGVVH